MTITAFYRKSRLPRLRERALLLVKHARSKVEERGLKAYRYRITWPVRNQR